MTGLILRRFGFAAFTIAFVSLIMFAAAEALNVIALTIAWLLTGVVVVEKDFNYPGLGTLMIQAIYDRDLPLVQAIALIFSVIYVGVNLLADLAALMIDPRLRRKGH